MSTIESEQRSATSPIPTPANFPVTWDDPADERLYWMRDQAHTPEPITPLDVEFMADVFEAWAASYEVYDVPLRARVMRINGYFYLTFSPVDLSPEEKDAQAARAAANLRAVLERMGEIWRSELLPEVRACLADWERFDLHGASLPALLDHLELTIGRHRHLWNLHFRISSPAYIAISTFDDFYRDVVDATSALEPYRLLQGFENEMLKADRALRDLGRRARGDAEVCRVLESASPVEVLPRLRESSQGKAFLAELHAFLNEHGKRPLKPFHVSEPGWIEDPSPVIEILRADLGQDDRDPEAETARLVAERERLVAQAREQLRGYPQPVVQEFEYLLRAAQEGMVVSEDHNYWIDYRSTYAVRRALLEFGRRFAEAGVVDQPSDIFYLTRDEIRETAAILPRLHRQNTVAGRRAEVEYFRTIPAPAAVGTVPVEAFPDTPLMRAEFKWAGEPPAVSSEPDLLRGNAGSPGTVVGPARVFRSPGEAPKLHPGDVLVAETTAAPWTPLFGVAAAIVTDVGGVLCHAAAIAREYGIPAVVGTGNATSSIRDGQLLEVDGDRGTVRIRQAAG